MPLWQVLLLLLAALAGLYLVLIHTNPRARAAKVVVGHSRPKCYPLEQDHAVRLLGPENKAYHRTIATSSTSTQTLFDLGMLALHGFNQLEATAWFTVRGAVASSLTAGGPWGWFGVVHRCAVSTCARIPPPSDNQRSCLTRYVLSAVLCCCCSSCVHLPNRPH